MSNSKSTLSTLWRPLLMSALSLYGIGASIYLTYTHYSGAVIAGCPENAVINCAKVTTSPQSMIFGVPVALFGLFFYIPMFILVLPQLWRSESKSLAYLRQIYALSGMIFVLYLVAMEILVIKAICLWCTSVHVVTFLLFLILTMSWNYCGYALKRLGDWELANK